MNHDEAYERLPSLVGLRPAEEDDADLRAHVEGCAVCRARLDALRRVDEALRSGPRAAEPSDALRDRVLSVPHVHPQQRPAPSRRVRRIAAGGLGAAAAAIVALTLVVASPWDQGGGGPSEDFDSVQTAAISEPRQGVEATLEFGKTEGAVQPVRLTVSGLGSNGRYELWLTSGGGEVAVGTFKPGKDGACTVMMDVPQGDWSQARITHAAADEPGFEVASGPV